MVEDTFVEDGGGENAEEDGDVVSKPGILRGIRLEAENVIDWHRWYKERLNYLSSLLKISYNELAFTT